LFGSVDGIVCTKRIAIICTNNSDYENRCTTDEKEYTESPFPICGDHILWLIFKMRIILVIYSRAD